MIVDGVEFTFASEIATDDYQCILDCKFFKEWLASAKSKFIVQKIHFASVDFLKKVRSPLFIKLAATATLPDGRPVHGIVVVRGNAVGVLVVRRSCFR